MKLTILFLTFLVSTLTAQDFQWAIAGSGNGLDMGTSVTYDKNKNVIAAGLVLSTQFSIGSTNVNGNGSSTSIVVKLDSMGNHLWTSTISNAEAKDISCDALGNVYVTGGCGNSIFSGTSNSVNVQSSGSGDGFLAKFDPTGQIIWVKTFGEANSYEYGTAMKTNSLGETYLTGSRECKNKFDCHYNQQFFVLKFDTQGNLLWSKQGTWDSENYAYPTGLDLSNEGQCLVTGNFNNSVSIAGSTVTGNPGYQSIFILKLDTQGNLGWIKKDGTGYNESNSISCDNSDNFYLTGKHSNPSTFGNFTINNSGRGGMFLNKYDAQGNIQWVRTASENTWGRDVSVSGNSIFVAGWMDLTATFGEGNSAVTLTSTKRYNREIFVLKYDTDGTFKWVIQPGGSPSHRNQVMGIVAGGTDECYITGYFSETTVFGPSTQVAPSISSGHEDFFVAKLNENLINPVSLEEDMLERNDFIVYPVPATEILHVELKSRSFGINSFIALNNVFGQRLYYKSINATDDHLIDLIDLSKYSKGVYFVELNHSDGREVRKVIIE